MTQTLNNITDYNDFVGMKFKTLKGQRAGSTIICTKVDDFKLHGFDFGTLTTTNFRTQRGLVFNNFETGKFQRTIHESSYNRLINKIQKWLDNGTLEIID